MYGWLGALIGNNDMHLGNAGALLADARPLALAPAYDMLPMAFRPAVNGARWSSLVEPGNASVDRAGGRRGASCHIRDQAMRTALGLVRENKIACACETCRKASA